MLLLLELLDEEATVVEVVDATLLELLLELLLATGSVTQMSTQ